jgi:hypothetical protein
MFASVMGVSPRVGNTGTRALAAEMARALGS